MSIFNKYSTATKVKEALQANILQPQRGSYVMEQHEFEARFNTRINQMRAFITEPAIPKAFIDWFDSILGDGY